MKSNVFKSFAVSVMMVVSIIGLSSCGKNSDAIKLGLISNISGDAEYYGNQVKLGAQLAVDEINENGGIDGKKISLIIKDDAGDTTQATQQYNSLIDKGVVGIVGPVISSTSEAVAAQAAKDKFPMITPSGSAESITKNRPSVFRTCFTDPGQGITLAKLCKDKKYERVVVIKNSNSDYSTGVCTVFKNNASENGVTIVKELSYTNDNLSTLLGNFYTTINSLDDIDAIVFPDYTNQDYQMLSTFRAGTNDKYKNIAFVGADGWDGTEKENGVVKEYLNNCFYSTNLFIGSTDEVVKDFLAAFKEKYPNEQTPSQFCALAYDTVYMYKSAIEAKKSTKKDDIVDALKDLKFAGVCGSGEFDENGNPVKTASVVTWKDGVLEFYKTI